MLAPNALPVCAANEIPVGWHQLTAPFSSSSASWASIELSSFSSSASSRFSVMDARTRLSLTAMRDENELAALLASLKGKWLYMPSLLAAHTGLRRGEVLGLRWKDIDFTKATLQVVQQVENVGGKLRLKGLKSDRSRRTIKLPASLPPELSRHRKEQSAWRLKLGLGKDQNDLVFTSPVGAMLDPSTFSGALQKKLLLVV